jgi:hypothetical protein
VEDQAIVLIQINAYSHEEILRVGEKNGSSRSGMEEWTGLIWLRIGTGGGLL